MASPGDVAGDKSTAEALDDEISKLRAQVESLKKELKIQTTTILTADSTEKLIKEKESDKRLAATTSREQAHRLANERAKHLAHKQQCLYRAGASITCFKIQDPDPRAVDQGHVLGLRFEVMSRKQFLRPYYVMLNRPFADEKFLRIHRHTVPPVIPLGALAARYLPEPKKTRNLGDGQTHDSEDQETQDLSRFVRALRRELVRYQNRVTMIQDLRHAAGLGSAARQENAGNGDDEEGGDAAGQINPIVDIGPVDAENKQIRIDWRDGRMGRVVLDDDGRALKAAVHGAKGQDRDVLRELLGNPLQVERVADLLKSV